MNTIKPMVELYELFFGYGYNLRRFVGKEYLIMTGPATSTAMIDGQFIYGDREHDKYLQEGYLVFDKFLTDECLARCRKECDRMIDQLQVGRSPELIIAAHQQEPWIFELSRAPQIVDMLEKQIGPNIVLWSTHMLCKAPRTGEFVPWHQDAPYWNVRGNFGPGIWIPFDDIDDDNGAMAVLPGWHTKGTLARRDSGLDGFNEEIHPNAMPDDLDELKVAYTLRAGQAAIHNVMMPHASPPNRSDRWRRVLVLRYIAAGGEFGHKTYEDYRTGVPFDRQYILVRGEDMAHQGLKRSPI